MSAGRIHFEARLGALEAFYHRRLAGVPECERAALQSRVQALRVAAVRPQSELSLILYLSRLPMAKVLFFSLVVSSALPVTSSGNAPFLK